VYYEPRQVEQDRERNAADGGEQETLEGGEKRNAQGFQQQLPIVDQRVPHQPWAGQLDGRKCIDLHNQVPGRDAEHERRKRQHDAQNALRFEGAGRDAHAATPMACVSASEVSRQ
jgi:hypothetical protein